MKWLVLVVVVILAAPTIARRLEELNPDNAAKRAGSATAQQRRGLLYRAVRRFGLRTVALAALLVLVAVVVAVYLLIKGV